MTCIYESLYYIFAANLDGLTMYFQITMMTLDAFPFHCHLLRVLHVWMGWFVVFAAMWVVVIMRVFTQ
jgi:hypothetical protein